MSQDSQITRSLKNEDIADVSRIEKTVYEDPWAESLLRDSLKAPLTFTLGLFVSAEDEKSTKNSSRERCVAYGIYQLIYTEGHLLNLAVDPEFQHQGLGEKLLDAIIRDIKSRGGFSFFLEVRPSNKKARALYEKKGFRSLIVRENYYPNGESAIIMVAEL